MKRIILLIISIIVGVVLFVLTSEPEREIIPVVPQVVDTRCYVGTEPVFEGGEMVGNSYYLAKLEIYSDNSVSGELSYAPYQQERSTGSYHGSFDKETEVISGVYDVENRKEERYLKLDGEGILFAFGDYIQDEDEIYRYEDKSDLQYDYLITSSACTRYDKWYEELFDV